ncbi:TnsA-like heteromeric transposase endonuclease subunit [Protofrankia symbiont of Coriaria ruscifolia]|uniref:TnsA-like heteromeric transposase endonuclease subunit n=1 Tax=Protofrankia symbiont of Coriaria ruscifolia TaxID=1306542 RepID=UPI001040F71F|nr:TnsA-like heteromeric transposase endonuclease subunit [Protofrankia symbiont of Coriaria ruscifolia]
MGDVVDTQGVTSSDVGEFELLWVESDREVRRPLASVSTIAFEDVAPVRDFPSYRGQRHFPGLYWSATMGRHVWFESWLERDHAMLLDFDPLVVGFASQPFWLRWRDSAPGGARSHAPDYFARATDGSGLVVDCRPVDLVDARSAESFAATRRACEQAGWSYRLVGYLDGARVTNLRWLAGYRHPRFGEPSGLTAAVATAFAVPAPLTRQAATVGDPIAVLPVVFHLLWRGRLTADLSVPLSDRTLVRRSGRA